MAHDVIEDVFRAGPRAVRRGVLLVVAAFALGGTAASEARADVQVSARLGVGGGIAEDPFGQREGLFATSLRSEVLFGPARVGAFRLGPALELRTADFVTAEAGGGLAILLPVATGYPLVLTGGAGWAARPGGADGAYAQGTLAWGYRSYNHHHPYGYGLQLFVSGRRDLQAPAQWQVTVGVEIDLQFLVAIPALFVWEGLTSGDPHE